MGPSTTPAITAASIVGAASVSSGGVPVLLAALALASGVVLIASGIFRLGFIADFLSRPVLIGFVSGHRDRHHRRAAAQAASVCRRGARNTFDKAWTLIRHLSDTHGADAPRRSRRARRGARYSSACAPALPAALIVVGASIAASRAFDLAAKGVAVVAAPPSGLPSLAMPRVGLPNLSLVIGGGLALAFISYAESIGAARSIARRHGYEVDPNQELIALGGGNLLSGLIQGFPTDASLSRSAVADTNRVRSSAYGLVVLVLLVVTMLWLTPLIDGLPQATLAAVIIGAVYRLIDVKGLRAPAPDRSEGRLPARPRRAARRADVRRARRHRDRGRRVARRADREALPAHGRLDARARAGSARPTRTSASATSSGHPDCETFPGLVIVRFGGELFFANASYLRTALRGAHSPTPTPLSRR